MSEGNLPPGNCTTYEWRIKNFDMCPHSKDECLSSDVFCLDSLDLSEYRLSIYPRGRGVNDTCTCLLECRKSSRFPIDVTLILYLDEFQVERKKANVVDKIVEFEIALYEPNRTYTLLPGQLLTVRCTVTLADFQAVSKDLDDLAEDMRRLLDEGFHSDFTLTLSECSNIFYVHKAILAARCPVMAKRVGIYDDKDSQGYCMGLVFPGALKAFLEFIYTGTWIRELNHVEMNDFYVLAKASGMENHLRDLVPVRGVTSESTIVPLGHEVVEWNIDEFPSVRTRQQATLLSLYCGRFAASFSFFQDADGEIKAEVLLKCLYLHRNGALAVKYDVQVQGVSLGTGGHRFDPDDLRAPIRVEGELSDVFKCPPDTLNVVFTLVTSHLRFDEWCCRRKTVDTKSWFDKNYKLRAQHRLSLDMDVLYQGTLEGMQTLSDMGLVLGYRSLVAAHKCVLSVRSTQLLKTRDLRCRIYVSGVGMRTFHEVLRYAYCGKISDGMDMRGLLDVYLNSVKYGVKSLTTKCLQLIGSNVTLRNLPLIAQVANERPHDRNLLGVAMSFLYRSRGQLLNCPEWYDMLECIPKRIRSAFICALEVDDGS